jgi:dihydroxy-acid dehydratase
VQVLSSLLQQHTLHLIWPFAGCDKNMPGTLMAMARLNRPSLMLYGGTIKPGYSKINSGTLDIVSAFQSYGA